MKTAFVSMAVVLALVLSVLTFNEKYVQFSLEKINDSEGAWPSEELEQEKWDDPEAYAVRVEPYIGKRRFLARFANFFGDADKALEIIHNAYGRYGETDLEDHEAYMMMRYLEVVIWDKRNKLKKTDKLIDDIIERYPEHPMLKNLRERKARLRLRIAV